MTQSTAQRLASEIRAEMARQQYKQGDLAKATGMSQPAISRRLSGEVPFDLDDLDTVCLALNLVLEIKLAADART